MRSSGVITQLLCGGMRCGAAGNRFCVLYAALPCYAGQTGRRAMPIQPQPLPCAPSAFAPHLSTEAVERHRAAQLAGIASLNAMLEEAADPPPALEDLARSATGALAARAAQAWSEDFYWAALRPAVTEAKEPGGALGEAISQAFGDCRRMRERFAEAAARLPGPGWAWLLQRRDGRLAIAATPQSATPLTGSDVPLLACCLWPHALLTDHPDARGQHLGAFWQLVDWRTVAARMR
jgi:Fe-Mn family superoxide dismutase